VRFVVFGAGAIGGVVGGRLHQHGHDVVLVARGAHHDAIRDRGLRVQSPDDDAVLDVPVRSSAAHAGFGRDDVVLLAVKSQDTFAAAQALAEHASSDTPVVALQNGVANEPMLLRWFANVYGVCVMAPTAHVEPGVVQAQSAPINGLLDIGRYPFGVDATATAVAGALGAATFESVPRDDIMRWKYAKLLMNLGNAVQATCAPDDAARDLVRAARREGEATLDAAGIDRASPDEDRERRGDLLTVRPISGAMRGGGSTWQSFARGTGSVEVDYLNGEIVLIGRRIGIPTPVNHMLCEVTNRMARERAAPQSASAAELLAGIG
jgi:2-dehydropantoate 2-reductase